MSIIYIFKILIKIYLDLENIDKAPELIKSTEILIEILNEILRGILSKILIEILT